MEKREEGEQGWVAGRRLSGSTTRFVRRRVTEGSSSAPSSPRIVNTPVVQSGNRLERRGSDATGREGGAGKSGEGTTSPGATGSGSGLESGARSETGPGREGAGLRDWLRDPTFLEVFEAFVTGCHAQENLAFWMAVENYRQLRTEMARVARAQEMSRRYLQESSLQEINIDGQMRQELLEHIHEIQLCDKNLFDPAQKAIFRIMDADLLPKFTKSAAYKEYKAGRSIVRERTAIAFERFIDEPFYCTLGGGGYGRTCKSFGWLVPKDLLGSLEGIASSCLRCLGCNIPFTTMRRRHYCHHCGLFFCGDCSANTIQLLRERTTLTTKIDKPALLTAANLSELYSAASIPWPYSQSGLQSSKERICNGCCLLMEKMPLFLRCKSESVAEEQLLRAIHPVLQNWIAMLNTSTADPIKRALLRILHIYDVYFKHGFLLNEIVHALLPFLEQNNVHEHKTIALHLLSSIVVSWPRNAAKELIDKLKKTFKGLPAIIATSAHGEELALAAARLLFNFIAFDASSRANDLYKQKHVHHLAVALISTGSSLATALVTGSLYYLVFDDVKMLHTLTQKSSAMQNITDLFSLSNPRKSLGSLLFGSKIYGVIAEDKYLNPMLHADKALLIPIMRLVVAPIDSEIVEAVSALCAHFSQQGKLGAEFCLDKAFLSQFIILTKHYSDEVKKQVACTLSNLAIDPANASVMLEVGGLTVLARVITGDEETQQYVTDTILQLEKYC